MNTSIEITDQEYLIKLPREKFDLKFISALIKRIQSEQLFFTGTDEEDLISRRLDYDRSARFDHLGDK